MDPNAAWNDLQYALLRRDRSAVAEAADALIGWLRKDGAPPDPIVRAPFARLTPKELLGYLNDLRLVAEMV
jgi:hypothetical protein